MIKLSKTTVILSAILAICLAVLSVLAVAVIKNASQPAQQPEVEWMEIPNFENMRLTDAKAKLDELQIYYEIMPTESKVPNRVERFEYVGKAEGEKIFARVGTSIKLHANEVGADKVVYLTFDDGPTYSNTFDILDTLDKYGAKATFFVLGNRVEEYADRIIATHERGHMLACHSYSHDIDRASSGFIYASTGAMINEINMYEQAMKKVLGEENFSTVKKAFRFPGGSSTNGRISKAEALEYIAAIRTAGYAVYDWTVLTGDAEGNKTTESFIAHLKNGLKKARENGEPIIVLMHDKLTTSESLPEILDYLIDQGYYFDTLDNCPEYTFAED